jgi:hypothetical protein
MNNLVVLGLFIILFILGMLFLGALNLNLEINSCSDCMPG